MNNRFSLVVRASSFARALLLAVVASLTLPSAGLADWKIAAKDAAIKYADDKKNEIVKEQTKAAVVALAAKLKKSGASAKLVGALSDAALSTTEINKLAEETADAFGSGDREKMHAASEELAVKYGELITRFASTPEAGEQLKSLIGSADTVKEVSAALGNAVAGTSEGRREAAKYFGEKLISLTPAAGVISAVQGSYAAMNYVNNKFIDSEIEEVYQRYRNDVDKGDRGDIEMLRDQLDHGAYAGFVVKLRGDLRQKKEAKLGDAAEAASDRLHEYMANATDEEVIRNMFASFDGRLDKEQKDAVADRERTKALEVAGQMLGELKKVADKHDPAWFDKTTYNLDKFTSLIRDQLKGDGVLDPDNAEHLRLMSDALSTALVYGKDSPEYAQQLAAITQAKKDAIDALKGAACLDHSDSQVLAIRMWQKGKQLATHGKLDAAVPLLKQSLELCPDADRAAQLAELIKAPPPPTQMTQQLDGTYKGSLVWKPGPGSGTADPLTGSLSLTIKNGTVSGTVTIRDEKVVYTGQISGRMTPDGQITATVNGKSVYTGPDADYSDILRKAFYTFTFEGPVTGQISAGGGTGKYSVTSHGGAGTHGPTPNFRLGNWTANRG